MMAAPSRFGIIGRMAVVVIVPSIPVLVWWKGSREEREARTQEVRTKVRVPNVQTVDDLMVEKCRPGDVIVFDRRCEKCAAGPLAAMTCLMGRSILCNDNAQQTRNVETGLFDHCGVVVPGYTKNKSDEFDPSNLLLLEATAGDGIVARPLLTRLEMSQSRSVILLPLCSAGERRYDDDYEPTEKTQRLCNNVHRDLCLFRDEWIKQSNKQNYHNAHSTLGIVGSLGYALGLEKTSRAPVSPSAWLVLSALEQAGVAMKLNARTALETKVEDFLRDSKFHDRDTVRLRPGWKFLPPVPMREMSRQ